MVFHKLVTQLPQVLMGADATEIVDPTTSGGGLSGLFDTGLKIVDFAFDMFDIMIAHPVLSIFIAVGLVSLGVGLVGKFAGTAHSIG